MKKSIKGLGFKSIGLRFKSIGLVFKSKKLGFKSKGLGFKSMKMQLAATFLLIIVVVCASLGYLSYYHSSKGLLNAITDDLQARAIAESKLVAAKMEGNLKVLDGIAKKEAVREMDWSEIPGILVVESLGSGFLDVGVADLNGQLTLGNGMTADISDRAYFIQTIEGRQACITDPIPSLVTGALEILQTAPIKGTQGEIVGAVVARTAGDRLSALISDIKVGKTGYAYMLNQEGTTIAHPDLTMVFKQDNILKDTAEKGGLQQLKDIEKRMIAGEEGWGEYAYQGKTRLMAFAPVGVNGWSIAVDVPQNELLTPIDDLMRSIAVTALIILAISACIGVWTGMRIGKPIQLAAAKAAQLATGDFSESVSEKFLQRKDEIGNLARSFQQMIVNLNGFVKEVQQGAENVAAASEQMSAGTQQISSGTQEEANLVQNVVLSMETITGQTADVVDTATQAMEIAGKTSDMTSRGEAAINHVIEGMQMINGSMHELNKNSGQIEDILMVINEISEQTNLLALNAAIEAARAGEHGRGFAVVAEEVRKLAERSGNATKEIANLIKVIQGDIGKAVSATEKGEAMTGEAQKAFGQIGEMVQENNKMVQNMGLAAQKAAEGVEETAKSFESISAVTEETAASIEEIAASAQEMAGMAENLQSMLGKFRV